MSFQSAISSFTMFRIEKDCGEVSQFSYHLSLHFVRHCFLVVGSYFLLRKERAVVLTVPLMLTLSLSLGHSCLGVSLQSENLL